MRGRRHTTSKLIIAIGGTLSLLLAIGLALKVFAGIGPQLPGPHVRELVGVVAPFAPCKPDPARVRRPSQPVTTSIRWRAGPPAVPALANEQVHAVAIGGQIYVGTGVRANKGGALFRSLKSLYAYDPATRAYRRAPDLPQALDHTALVTWRGNLYLFGGFTDSRPSANAWRYSPRTGQWTELAPMRQARGGLAGAVIGSRFYAVGGVLQQTKTHPDIFGTLEIYDFRTNHWSRGPAMPTARHHVAAVALGGKLYAVGGRSDRDLSLPTFERFDPATRRWKELPALPLGVGDPAAVVTRGRIVVLSGGDDAEKWVTPATWSFDPATSRWSRLSDLIRPRHGFGAAVAGGRIYVFGGAPCAGYGRTGATESIDVRAVG
jgi:N-acetylneuraminic acid mutarotase